MTRMPDLAERWRQEAALFRKRGQSQVAALMESMAADYEAVERERVLEELTLTEAVEESGYSYSALQKMLASGQLENLGEKHAPRVRRVDLPRKARGEREQRSIAERVTVGIPRSNEPNGEKK